MSEATRAHIEYDPARLGVRLAVRRQNHVLTWTDPGVHFPEGAEAVNQRDDVWLHLQEDDARAIYEALADYFGHAGHDTRALRRDYEAERARVDRLIEYVTAAPIRIISGGQA